jgi:HD-like signal output (HDOD) protein
MNMAVSPVEDERLIQAIIASGVKIPPMPDMLLRVLALEGDDDAGPREFAALIGRDPALSGALFRVVGSPVLGLRVKVDNLEKAVNLLGLRATVAVARGESLRAAFGDAAQSAATQAIWARMNAVADIVMATCRTLRLKGVRDDQAYLAGIFHDCGLALICRRDADYAKAFADGGAWPDLERLDTEHATNHAVVGTLVARNWQLPPDVALVVRHHHDKDVSTQPVAARTMIVLIQFACHILARRAGLEEPDWEDLWRARAEALCAEAGSDLQELEQLML